MIKKESSPNPIANSLKNMSEIVDDGVLKRFRDGDYKFFTDEVKKSKSGTKVSSAKDLENPEPNSTGSFGLDFDLTIPIPTGRITEIFGSEGSGKTSLALEIVGQGLKRGKRALYLNMERNLNRSLLETIRSIKPFIEEAANENNLFSILTAPDGETALEMCRKWCVTNPNTILVLDSVDACVPAAILAGEIGENFMGNHAKLMSDAMRKLITAVEENNVAFICINQWRNKIVPYGDPRTTTGGDALRYYASQRIEVQKPGKAEMIKTADDGDIIGFNIRYKIIKNKCAPQGQEGTIPILFYNGIYREQEVIYLSLKFGLLSLGGRGGKQVLLPTLNKDGTESEPVAFGKFNAARRLLLDKELYDHLTAKLNAFLAQCTIKSNPIEKDEVQES